MATCLVGLSPQAATGTVPDSSGGSAVRAVQPAQTPSVVADPAAGAWGPAYPVVLHPSASKGEHGVVAASVRRRTTLLHAVTLGAGAGGAVLRYGRSARNGAGWSQRARISRPAWVTAFGVAAAGQRVYVAWTRHRTLVVRINDGYGRASRWSAVRRLGRFSGAGDMSMAATGSSVFVALRTGAGIVLWASRDGGSRWTKMRVAPWQCNRDDWDDPLSVAASGRLVAIAWTRCEAPAQVRISRDSGRHWARVHDGAAAPGTVSLAVRHGRVALSGTTGDGSASEPVRTWWQLWQGAGWSAIRHVDLGRTSQVVLPGGNALAFAHVDQGISLGGEPQERLLWTRSADLGRSWAAPVEVAACALPRYVAGFDVARGSGGSEHILYNLYQPGADVRAFVRSSV